MRLKCARLIVLIIRLSSENFVFATAEYIIFAITNMGNIETNNEMLRVAHYLKLVAKNC